jgi:hypothetical protein
VPTDGEQQVHGQALIDHVWKFKAHFQDWDEETEIEEQQQWLEQVVGEVVPELMKHRFLLWSTSHKGIHKLLNAIRDDLGESD